MPYMKWGAKRPRSKPIYKKYKKKTLDNYKPPTFAEFQRLLKQHHVDRVFGRDKPRIMFKGRRRTGYKVKTYSKMRWKRRMSRPWR